ncbi:hypothetical protein [uncultured Dokdonia sp.]|uniref:hypothetical protein n=1 Tax=uncultured Dokdonia sp. TaxID=575653 RepID=UPI00263396E7|nr:hypothetical protein [uncultured Dokdonia sp.]
MFWEKRVLQKIKSIKSFWSYWTIAGHTDRTYYPQDICIEFENNTKVWISAIEITETYTNAGSDHITVTFDETTRSKYHIDDRSLN